MTICRYYYIFYVINLITYRKEFITIVVTLNLDPILAQDFQEKAQKLKIPLEQFLLKIIDNSLYQPSLHQPISIVEEETLTPEKVMAEVRMMPPNPHAIIKSQGSLLEALQSAPDDVEFDLQEWNEQWRAVESEMRETTRQNSIQEGLI